jgi:cyclophilin family peptidyl-prolyl cis-trans isomerase
MNTLHTSRNISRRNILSRIKQTLAATSVCLIALSMPTFAEAKSTKAVISTSMGDITLELNAEKAPVTVKNFLEYVKAGHYNNTIFHRVIDGFMIQGGGMDAAMNEKKTNAPIKLESSNGLKNTKGTVAMARTQDPNSATAQFFINVGDNDFLNYRKFDEDTTMETPRGTKRVPKGTVIDGYAVFGEVTAGMDVVEKIKAVATTTKGPHGNVPVEPVTIKSIKLVDTK